jgi:Family of unknown function (DUF6134)
VRHGVISRRVLLAGVAAVGGRSALAGLPVPRGDRLTFRLMRHGSVIGNHEVAFRRDGEVLDVDIAVDVLVKFGPIPLVRYTHRNRETWRQDRLVGLSAETNRNGTRLHMSARWTDAGLVVEGSGARRYIAPPDALPTTYWNPRMLLGPMIGTQDGMLVRPVVTPEPVAPVRVASGDAIHVRQYRLSGDLDLELWYDPFDTWTGMRFSVDDGSVITYERL